MDKAEYMQIQQLRIKCFVSHNYYTLNSTEKNSSQLPGRHDW